MASGSYSFDVHWGDGGVDSITSWNQAEVTHTYSISGTYDVILDGTVEGFAFQGVGDKDAIVDISFWGPLQLGNR